MRVLILPTLFILALPLVAAGCGGSSSLSDAQVVTPSLAPTPELKAAMELGSAQTLEKSRAKTKEAWRQFRRIVTESPDSPRPRSQPNGSVRLARSERNECRRRGGDSSHNLLLNRCGIDGEVVPGNPHSCPWVRSQNAITRAVRLDCFFVDVCVNSSSSSSSAFNSARHAGGVQPSRFVGPSPSSHSCAPRFVPPTGNYGGPQLEYGLCIFLGPVNAIAFQPEVDNSSDLSRIAPLPIGTPRHRKQL